MSEQGRYRAAGVDIAAAEAGLGKIIAAIKGTGRRRANSARWRSISAISPM